MSDRLDRQIRSLVTELVEAAPDAPPLPEPGVAPAPKPQLLPIPPWARGMALAAAALVIVAGSAVGIGVLLSGDGDEAAAPITTVAATTTGAPATTAATTTTVAATTTAPPVTAAPTTTTSPDAAETTTTTAPADPRAAAISALDLQCPLFVSALQPLFAVPFGTPDDYRAALDELEGELFGIRAPIELLPAGPEYDALTMRVEAVELAIDAARQAGLGKAPQRLADIGGELAALSSALVNFGAADCAGLADVIS